MWADLLKRSALMLPKEALSGELLMEDKRWPPACRMWMKPNSACRSAPQGLIEHVQRIF